MDRDLKRSRGLRMLLRRKRRTTSWALEKCKLSHVLHKLMDSWLANWTGCRTNECMYGCDEKKRKRERGSTALLPVMELVKFEPAAKTGCDLRSVPPFFICFNVWFKRKKIAWRSISRHFISWVGNSPSLLATKNVSCFHPADADWATQTHLTVLDKDPSEASALVNTIS